MLAALCLAIDLPSASAATVVNTITGGNAPDGMSSDGTHVWVTNAGDGTVSEIEIGPSAPDIVAAPAKLTRSTSTTLEFTSETDGAQFECSLDGSTFSACPSPQTYSDLADGPHTFQVREHDEGEDPGPTSGYSWVVYTHPPTVSIAAPSGTTTSQAAMATFHGTAEDGNNAISASRAASTADLGRCARLRTRSTICRGVPPYADDRRR